MRSRIGLTEAERIELSQRAASRSGRADDGRRARLILLLEAGHSWAQIRDKLDCNDAFISRWSQRFARERLAGLFSRHAGHGPRKLTPALEARVLNWTLKRKPVDGSTQWSTRKLGSALSISHMMVARVWAKHGLKPQRLDRYMASNDPDFERKAADIIGLYVNPPAYAAVFCVDEKTAIQALDRKDPVLPLSPGRAERHGFEYYRHGTLSLYAAFNTSTGEVLGKTAARHTSAEFVAFLADIVVNQPAGREIHVIADNLSAHKTKQVAEFLGRRPPSPQLWAGPVAFAIRDSWNTFLKKGEVQSGFRGSAAANFLPAITAPKFRGIEAGYLGRWLTRDPPTCGFCAVFLRG
jgi:transposase